MANLFNLDKFKTEISLPDFVYSLGFTPIKGKSGGRYLVFERISTDECLVLYKNKKGNWVYFDAGNPVNDGGHSIIDFVIRELDRNKQKSGISEAIKLISSYYNNKTFPENCSIYQVSNNSLSENQINHIIQNQFKALDDFSYFLGRGISEETVCSRRFHSILYSWERKVKETEKFSSIGTFMKSINENYQDIVGCLLSLKKGEKCHSFGSRSTSIWASVIKPDEKINTMIVTENFIDCISHFQLNKNELDDKAIRYYSTQGEMTDYQNNLLCNIARNLGVENLIIGFDNDVPGYIFRSRIFSNPILSDSKDIIENTSNIMVYSKNGHGKCEVSLSKEACSESEFTDIVSKHFNSSKNFNLDFSKNNEQYTCLIDFTYYGKADTVKWQELTENIISFRKCSPIVKNEIPFTNDFNDDLQCLKGISDKYFISKSDSGTLFLNNYTPEGGYESIKPLKENILKRQIFDFVVKTPPVLNTSISNNNTSLSM